MNLLENPTSTLHTLHQPCLRRKTSLRRNSVLRSHHTHARSKDAYTLAYTLAIKNPLCPRLGQIHLLLLLIYSSKAEVLICHSYDEVDKPSIELRDGQERANTTTLHQPYTKPYTTYLSIFTTIKVYVV